SSEVGSDCVADALLLRGREAVLLSEVPKRDVGDLVSESAPRRSQGLPGSYLDSPLSHDEAAERGLVLLRSDVHRNGSEDGEHARRNRRETSAVLHDVLLVKRSGDESDHIVVVVVR